MRALECLDGTRVEQLVPASNGSRHHVYFGVEVGSGTEVVAKVELIDGALETERRALAWGAVHGVAVPAIRTFSQCATPDGDAACLITERVRGTAPATPEAWERMGRALARLATIPWEGCGLETLTVMEFVALHSQRVDELGARLAPALGPTDAAALSLAPDTPLVFTHGDPGGGNYLDEGDGAPGTLLDWETAHVAPRGLDIARAVFIALIDGAPAKARAVLQGYRDEVHPDWRPTQQELRAWLVVAGVQFVHWRHERRGIPRVRPWEDAVDVLARALTSQSPVYA